MSLEPHPPNHTTPHLVVFVAIQLAAAALAAVSGRWAVPLGLASPAIVSLLWCFVANRRWRAIGIAAPRWRAVGLAVAAGTAIPVGAWAIAGLFGAVPIGTWSGVLERAHALGRGSDALEVLGGSPLAPLPTLFLVGLVIGVTVEAIAALGEELAWRGALHDIVRPLGMWRGSLVVGVVWALWHLPFYRYDVAAWSGVGVTCLLAAPALWMIRERTGSVFCTAIVHGLVNGLAGMATLTWQGPMSVIGMDAAAGWLAFLLADAVLLAVVGLVPFGVGVREGPQ